MIRALRVLGLWLFFDVGETLLSENSFHSYRNEKLFEILKSKKKDLTKEKYHEAQRMAILSRPGGESSRIRAIAKEVLKNEDDFYDAARKYREKFGTELVKRIEVNPNSMFRPYPEVKKVLEYLSKKYSLGVIANQHRNVRRLLEKTWDLSKYFKFMILSEEVGYKKPDPEIFQLALDKARIEPADAWMVGDRVDTDVAPAKLLGMKTIRVLHDSEFSIVLADGEDERPDFQFKDLKPLMNLF